MKKLLLILLLLSITVISKSQDCDTYKKKAIIYETIDSLRDSRLKLNSKYEDLRFDYSIGDNGKKQEMEDVANKIDSINTQILKLKSDLKKL